ncbi:MAG TPA: hypothetical protein VF407_25420, partial [Polyangiaceae bacterium]
SSLTRFASVAAFALCSALAPSAVAEPTKEACIDADEAAQRLRLEHSLRAAREKLTFCAQAACPGPLRSECAGWLEEVDAGMPSVVVEATDVAGAFVSDVRVSVDDVLVASSLEGRAIAVDPGPHHFKFQRSDGVTVTLDQTILEGEKNRKLVVHFPALALEPEKRSAPIPVAVYPLGALGVIGLGSFTFFAIEGKRQEDDLKASCGTRCSDSDAHSVQTKYIVADVSLAVSIVSIGAGIWLYLRSRGETTPQRPVAAR